MARFRKKPVEVDAVKWDGANLGDVLELVPTKPDGTFDLPNDGVHVKAGIGVTPGLGTLDIPTLEGVMTAQPGDWIIRGVEGEFYPCKPDIFEQTYEAV